MAERPRQRGIAGATLRSGAGTALCRVATLRSARAALLGFAALTAPACAAPDAALLSGELPVLRYDTAVVRLEGESASVDVRVEVAESHQQQMFGLMERTALPELHGMLFVYSDVQPADREFYMFRTRIPLDIAFIGGDGVIRNIVAMEPCEQPNPQLCRRYPAQVPFLMALEMNRGFFQRHGIGAGDRVFVSGRR